LLLVLAAVLVLRAIVPAGYMPGSMDGGPWFELCPDGLPVTLVNAIGGHHEHHAEANNGNSLADCSLGDILSAAAIPSDPGADAIAPRMVPSNLTPVRQAVVHGPYLSYAARAPPVASRTQTRN